MNKSVNEINGDESKLQNGLQDDLNEIGLLDFLQTIVDNLKLLVVGPLAVGIAALFISFLIPPTYTAKTQFLPPQQQQSAAASMLASLGSLGGLAGAVGGIKNPSEQYLAYLKSVTLQDDLIKQYKLQERYDADTKQDARKELAEKVRAASGKDGLISIEVDDKSPQFAADLANAHVEALNKLLSKLAVTDAQQRRLFFENQMNLAKEKLTQSEINLKATGVSGGALKSNPSSAVAAVAVLQAQVTAQEVKLGAMKGYLTETAPDFKQAMSELVNLRGMLLKQEIGVPEVDKNSVKNDYVTKYREFKYNETLFELFAKQYELAKIDEAREGAIIQVLDVAQPPEKKTKPKKLFIVLVAMFASLLISITYLLLRKTIIAAMQDKNKFEKIINIKKSWEKQW
jgi:tyrosine-protein kinase Etk/Wzc